MSKNKKNLKSVSDNGIEQEQEVEKEESNVPVYMKKEYLESYFVLPKLTGIEVNILRQSLLRLIRTESEVNAWETLDAIYALKQKIDAAK
jgi:hypothetical protein